MRNNDDRKENGPRDMLENTLIGYDSRWSKDEDLEIGGMLFGDVEKTALDRALSSVCFRSQRTGVRVRGPWTNLQLSGLAQIAQPLVLVPFGPHTAAEDKCELLPLVELWAAMFCECVGGSNSEIKSDSPRGFEIREINDFPADRPANPHEFCDCAEGRSRDICDTKCTLPPLPGGLEAPEGSWRNPREE